MKSHIDSSTDSHSNNDQEDKDIDFGSMLSQARKTKNYTVEEVSEYLKIPVRTIVALETNDKSSLPVPTFAQGYIRAYAKFLEMSEDRVLAAYNRAVPHGDVSDLKPRSNLPGEANSQSPLIKIITMLLIVTFVATIGFGGFQYYQKKADVMESELDAKQHSFTGNSLDSPGAQPLKIKQATRLSEESEPAAARSNSLAAASEAAGKAEVVNQNSRAFTAATTQTVETIETEADTEKSEISSKPDNNSDTIEIYAENGSWVEVRDANKSRLLYNMLPVGGSRVLAGHAPFSVTMGNARTTRVVVNDIEIDVSNYIRSTNTASFKVSTQGQDVIFH